MSERPRLASGIVDGERVDLLPVGESNWRGPAGFSLHRYVTNLRPLYVLDLGSCVSPVLTLVDMLHKDSYDDLSDQLEAQIPAPALPDEPGVHAVADVTLPDGTVELERWEFDGASVRIEWKGEQ